MTNQTLGGMMSTNDALPANYIQSVGAVLWAQIRQFKDRLNIVESPSVGTLVAPARTCQLMGYALKIMLEVPLKREAEYVRVRCGVERRNLVLEVVSNHVHKLDDLATYAELEAKAHEFGGEWCEGHASSREVSTVLTLPLG